MQVSLYRYSQNAKYVEEGLLQIISVFFPSPDLFNDLMSLFSTWRQPMSGGSINRTLS